MRTNLSEIVIDKILRDGPVSFYEFMNMALYHPGLGYYSSGKHMIGKGGDYYTSSSVSSIFGEMMGRQIEEMLDMLGGKDLSVVEMGAGMGLMALDILNYLKKKARRINYHIVEKSPPLRDEQRKRLGTGVNWHDSIRELDGMTGVIFSNELVDAFPVHIVVMKNELKEVFVDYKDGFVEVLRPALKELEEYLAEQDALLPTGFRTEINLDAVKWIHDVGSSLKRGYVITIDYGYPAAELYQEHRNLGTLMCYYRHTANDNPYQHVGDQDMTSHVNFSALGLWGQKSGLEMCGFTDQMHFLSGLGIEEQIKRLQEYDPVSYTKKLLQIKTLIIGMGETFKVLIQKKGTKCGELSGLKYPSRWKI